MNTTIITVRIKKLVIGRTPTWLTIMQARPHLNWFLLDFFDIDDVSRSIKGRGFNVRSDAQCAVFWSVMTALLTATVCLIDSFRNVRRGNSINNQFKTPISFTKACQSLKIIITIFLLFILCLCIKYVTIHTRTWHILKATH